MTCDGGGVQRLTTQQLQSMRDREERPVVLHVSSEAEFSKEHIPQSANVPVDEPDFVERVRELVGDDDRRALVVYNADRDDDASSRALRRLHEAGFRRLYHYEGGIKAWREAGILLEGDPGSSTVDT